MGLIMKKPQYLYKKRLVCPHCLSLSIKKSYKEYKCDSCKKTFDNPKLIYLMHKENRCIDNDLTSRVKRLHNNKIIYN